MGKRKSGPVKKAANRRVPRVNILKLSLLRQQVLRNLNQRIATLVQTSTDTTMSLEQAISFLRGLKTDPMNCSSVKSSKKQGLTK